MKRVLFLLVLNFLVLCSNAQQRKAIFVIADGIPADLIEKLNTPHLDEIAQQGGYARAMVGGEKGGYSETPTISAVGYNTVLTGTWVNKHNVWDNDIAAPNYNYPTIFRLLKDQYPEKKIAIFSSWLDNRTKLVGDGLPQTRNIHFDHHFDGMELDTVNYPHDRNMEYMKRIDNDVIDHAASYIRSDAPDLSWVYLEFTDDMGHRYGDSKQFFDAISLMDDQMGRLWESIKYRQQQHSEEWQIYITTDHGRDSATGKNHGGQSNREKLGWIVTNAKGLNNYFKKGQASIADIMPSIARFLRIDIPATTLKEVDGIPLTGSVGLSHPLVTVNGNQLLVSWQPLNKKGNVNIYISSTNNAKTGGVDSYELIKKVKLKKGKASFTLKEPLSNFYKLVLESKHNTVNRWVYITSQ